MADHLLFSPSPPCCRRGRPFWQDPPGIANLGMAGSGIALQVAPAPNTALMITPHASLLPQTPTRRGAERPRKWEPFPIRRFGVHPGYEFCMLRAVRVRPGLTWATILR